MEISRLQQVHQAMTQQIQSQQMLNQPTAEVKETSGFGDMFIQQLQATNQLQYEADTELMNFMIGESENLHDVMISMEEARISLELTTQVRNRVVEAYQELKNMQI